MIVCELAARAWLAHPDQEVDQARQRAHTGDPDWRQWVQEFDRGEAALMNMQVALTVQLDDGSIHTVTIENHCIWIELLIQPPALKAVIAEISSQDFELLAHRISQLGASITVLELEQMHVTVHIADNLLAALRPPAASSRPTHNIPAPPQITTENA